MTLKQIARAIADNVRALDCGIVTYQEFSAENHRLWDLVNRGELCIIGSNAAKRSMKVNKYLRSI